MHGADRRARRGCAVGHAARTAHALFGLRRCRTSSRTGLAGCLGLEEGAGAHHRARRGRRLRIQGNPAARRRCARLAGDALRPSGALDRGSARASDRRRQLPRAPLPHHRLCRPRRPVARHRLRGDRRFRRLFVLSVLRLPRGRAGREHPARTVRLSCISLPHLLGRHQQVPDPAVPRRRAHRRLLRARTRARRDRARSRRRAARGALRRSGAARADAVRQHHQQAFRQRRLSAKRCAAPWRRSTSTPCGRASSAASRTDG